jgi:MFS transporter, PPP family, 3-phenylpropionic acid transporter
MLFILLLQLFMLPSSPFLDSILLKAAVKRGSSYGKLRLWGSIGFALSAIALGLIMQTIGGIEMLPWFY